MRAGIDFRRLPHRAPVESPLAQGYLTLSGNEITDASRALSVQGDGRSADSSFGIWPAATNLCTNGGFESNTTGWTNVGTGVGTRITTDHKFGTACMEVNNSAVTDGVAFTGSGNASQSTPYTASFEIKAKAAGDVGAEIQYFVDAVGGTYENINSTVALTADWQRVELPVTFANAGHTGWRLVVRDGAVGTKNFRLDGVQYETGSVATPYIETNGATATRAAARVQAPASLLNATQGWVAMRVRPGFASTDATIRTIMKWPLDGSNYIDLAFNGAAGWKLDRDGAATLGTSTQASGAFAVGSMHTIVGKWTSANVAVSVNGAPFTSAVQSAIPALVALVDIGSDGATPWSGDSFWAAFGSGALTDADAAYINNFGNADPDPRALPGQCTTVMPFRNSDFLKNTRWAH